MSLAKACPPEASLTSIPAGTCKKGIGQIQKAIFQRGGNTFPFSGVGDATLLASWTPFLSASDDTKVTTTPLLGDATVEPGAARLAGGGNATPNGIEEVRGREPSPFTAMMRDTDSLTVEAVRKLEQEIPDLTVFFINQHDEIIGQVDDNATPTTFEGFPIGTLFVGDKGANGLEEADMNALNFSMFPKWDERLHFVKAVDFSPLTALVNP